MAPASRLRGLPRHISIYPDLAWAALRQGETLDLCTWALLGTYILEYHGGRGTLDRAGAQDLLAPRVTARWKAGAQTPAWTTLWRRILEQAVSTACIDSRDQPDD